MSDLLIRTVTGMVMIAAALAAAAQGGTLFAVFVAAAATAMYYEWSRITRGWGLAWWIGGFFYALIPALALLWVRERSLVLLLWVFLVTWATDIGAYLVGRTFGRRKLAPAISPGKTMAGLYGGITAAGLLSVPWVLLTGLNYSLILLAPFFSIAAQGGDLFESWMKRRAGVKNSGEWLPGHGGLLDRLDGLVPVAVLAAIAQLLGLT